MFLAINKTNYTNRQKQPQPGPLKKPSAPVQIRLLPLFINGYNVG